MPFSVSLVGQSRIQLAIGERCSGLTSFVQAPLVPCPCCYPPARRSWRSSPQCWSRACAEPFSILLESLWFQVLSRMGILHERTRSFSRLTEPSRSWGGLPAAYWLQRSE